MGGDYVKHSFPLAGSMMTLAWSLLHFGPAYQQVCHRLCVLACGAALHQVQPFNTNSVGFVKCASQQPNYARVVHVYVAQWHSVTISERVWHPSHDRIKSIHVCVHMYLQAGMLSELRGSLLVGTQYLMDCHIGPGQFVAQVRGRSRQSQALSV